MAEMNNGQLTPIFQYAKMYSDHGICVIPIKQALGEIETSKRPIGKWKQYQDARPTDDELHNWFNNGRPRNLALLGGQISGNILWLDFDDEAAYHQWAAEYPRVADMAPTQATGKGYHVGIRTTGPTPKSGDLYYHEKHIGDLKGEGGYIVAAPSIHGSGRKYEWTRGPWETEFPVIDDLAIIGLSARDTKVTPKGGTTAPAGAGDRHPKAQSTIETVLGRLAAATDGTRNTTLNEAAFTLGGIVGNGQLTRSEAERMLLNTALAIGLSERETQATIKSGLDSGFARPFDNPDETVIHDSAAVSDNVDLLSYPAADEGNAQCVSLLHGDRFLYTDEVGWLMYNGRYWKAKGAEAELNRAIVDTLIQRRTQAVKADLEPIVKATKPSAGNVRNCKYLFQSLVWASIDEFDSDPDQLNCKNGVVNLADGTISPHHHEQRFTYCLNVAYDPQGDYSDWENWLHSTVTPAATDDDGRYTELVHWLQKAIGYSFTGHTHENCFFYLYGPTRSGKGVFVQTLMTILGKPMGKNINFEVLTANRQGDTQNFDLAPLKPARFLGSSENSKNKPFNEALVKRLTGDDEITAAFKHRTSFDYKPMYKTWISSNFPIRGDAADDAFWGRARVITFPNSHLGKEDRLLKKKLLSNSEGILKWAIEGAIEWGQEIAKGNGKALEMPSLVKGATEHHRGENDTIQQFIDECCRTETEAKVKGTEFKAEYKKWCDENSFPALGGRNIKLALDRKGFKYGSVRDGPNVFKGWAGLGLDI